MQLKPVFDAGWALGVGLFGAASMMILIPLSIIVEAIIIHYIFFKPKQFWPPVKISLIINLISGAIGWVVVLQFFYTQVDSLSIYLTGNPTTYETIAPLVRNFLLLEWLIGTLICSIVIEGILLTWFFYKKHSVITIWLTAVVINIISYLGIGLIGSAGYFFDQIMLFEMIGLAFVYALCIYLLFSLGTKLEKRATD